MKILLVNTRHFYGGGDSTYTFSLAKLLRDNGHNVSFFAMQDKRNFPDPNEDLFVSPIDFRQFNQEKNLANGLKVLGRAIYSQEARKKFSALIDRVKPDIVHLQNIHAHITPSIILEAKRQHLPVAWTLHDYKLICPNSHFLIDRTKQICEACTRGGFLQATLKRCKKGSLLASGMASLEAYAHNLMGVRNKVDAYLSPSAFLVRKFREAGVRERIHHLPLFVSEEFFHQSDNDEGYILFIGKLEPIKGIYQLLEACRKLPMVRAKIAGSMDEIEATRIRSLLGKNIEYVGIKSGDELRNLIRRCRAVVVPSICYENQPFAILEVFASGKPVVASGIGGMKELVADGLRGLLVEPGNVEKLGQALTWMSEHANVAHKMGKSALAYAWEVHSPGKHYQALMRIYQNILSEN